MGSYTAAVVTDGVLLSTAMSSRQLLLVTALCASLVHSKILRSSIVRGQGFAAPPPGHTLNISPLQQQEAPRQQQAVSHFSQPRKPVMIISEFDRPGSFQPMKANYNKQKFEPTTEKSFVSGPPLGDDFFDRYTGLIKRHQKKQKKRQLSFAGLLPADLVDRRKRKHQEPQAPAFYQIKAPVTLDYASKPLEDFGFNPNGKWYGEQATGLLQPPAHNIKHRQVSLDFASPSSSSSFSPNNNWFGEKQTGFFSYPSHLVPKRDSVEVKVPAKKGSTKESFSPSGWHVYRNKVAETGTRSSVYNVQDEPAIITLDNMAKYLKHSHNSVGGSPDVFDVNVQAVIKTKDAPNASQKFYLSRI